MRRFLVAACLALCVAFPTREVLAAKFLNKDTATDRQDETMGTRQSEETVTIDNNAKGENIEVTPKPQEQKDWYENMVIGVDVDANGKPKKPKP
jgi:hypothetical protein